MPSTTAPLTWPSAAELDILSGCIEGVYPRLEPLADALNRLVNLDSAPSVEEVSAAIERGAEPLSLETVGALSSCLAKIRFDLEHLVGTVEHMERQRDVMALEVVTPKRSGNAG